MKFRHLLLVFVILLFGALVSMNLEQLLSVSSDAPSAAEGHLPAYFFDNFKITATTPQGIQDYILKGRRLVRYVDDETSEVTAPHLRLFGQTAADWEVVAKQAWISADGEWVELQGDVLLTRHAYRDHPEMLIKTERLEIAPERKYAETDLPVRIETQQWQVDSVGMTAFLGTGLVELLSNVRGIYEPLAP